MQVQPLENAVPQHGLYQLERFVLSAKEVALCLAFCEFASRIRIPNDAGADAHSEFAIESMNCADGHAPAAAIPWPLPSDGACVDAAPALLQLVKQFHGSYFRSPDDRPGWKQCLEDFSASYAVPQCARHVGRHLQHRRKGLHGKHVADFNRTHLAQ